MLDTSALAETVRKAGEEGKRLAEEQKSDDSDDGSTATAAAALPPSPRSPRLRVPGAPRRSPRAS